ncbi:hypothetical protein AB0I35_31270 [Nocardia sp. NPDC050378]|uniref:hypothetical protein n=1 Tax=Nocardia sp. NPDC050378 TaxID=3155400 RepID=UPI0033C5CE1C
MLVPPHAEPVYPGDDPRHPPDSPATRSRILDTQALYRRADYSELFDELARSVRTDADTAHRELAFLLATDPSPANLDRERDILIRDTGMPPDFVRTRAETEALLILRGHARGEIARVLAEFAPRLSGPAANLFVPEDLARLRPPGTVNGVLRAGCPTLGRCFIGDGAGL